MTITSNGRSRDTKKKFDVIAPDVARLHREGLSQAAIARQLHVAPSTVGRAAQVAGVSFDREVTAPATAAAQVDAHHRREKMSNALYGMAARSMQKTRNAMDADDPGATKAYATTSGIFLDRVLKFDPLPDPKDESEENSRTALDELHNAIVASAMTFATPEELALMNDGLEPDVDDEEADEPDEYEPQFRAGGDFL